MTLMHCWIQIPRLICLVRQARTHGSQSTILQAISLASTLWTMRQPTMVEKYFASSTSTQPVPTSLSISDIVGSVIHFGSTSNLMLLTHGWLLVVYLCGLIHTLQKAFPMETACSDLPCATAVMATDTDAALHIAKAFIYASSNTENAPSWLLLWRILGPLQTSTGTWLRAVVQNNATVAEGNMLTKEIYEAPGTQSPSQEKRMIEWILEESRRVAKRWGFAAIDIETLKVAEKYVSGGVEWHGLDLAVTESMKWKVDKMKESVM